MKHKLLPLPLGDDTPRGSSVRFWQQYSFRARLDNGVMLLGLIFALGGAWLGVNRSPVAVAVDSTGYHVGGTVLPPLTAGRYGGDAAIVLRQDDGEVRAAAAGRLGGAQMQGLCVYVIGSDVEQCIFVVGTKSFHAEDRVRGDVWRRRYDDGRTIDIKLVDRAHPTPVPLPLGWSP